jgi:hypothetical protein
MFIKLVTAKWNGMDRLYTEFHLISAEIPKSQTEIQVET